MLSRVARIQGQLILSWDVLSTMTPFDYASFRDKLQQSSGFQSYQYRTLEFILGNKNKELIEVHRETPEICDQLEKIVKAPSVYDLPRGQSLNGARPGLLQRRCVRVSGHQLLDLGSCRANGSDTVDQLVHHRRQLVDPLLHLGEGVRAGIDTTVRDERQRNGLFHIVDREARLIFARHDIGAGKAFEYPDIIDTAQAVPPHVPHPSMGTFLFGRILDFEGPALIHIAGDATFEVVFFTGIPAYAIAVEG